MKLFVFVKTCFGAPIWILDAIPMHIGWTFCRPPTEGAMVDTPDCEQAVQAALQVVVVEHSRASGSSLPQPLLQHCLPKVSRRSCVVQVANSAWEGIVRCKLAREDVALCSIDGLLNRLVSGLRHDTFQRTAVVVGRSNFLFFCFALLTIRLRIVQSTHGGLNRKAFSSSIALRSSSWLNTVCTKA